MLCQIRLSVLIFPHTRSQVDTDHFLQLIVMTALPPLLVLLVFVGNLLVACFDPRDAVVRTTRPALVIVYAVFPISATTIFNTFMTESFDDGNKRLSYDLSFDVTDPRYDLMFKYANIEFVVQIFQVSFCWVS